MSCCGDPDPVREHRNGVMGGVHVAYLGRKSVTVRSANGDRVYRFAVDSPVQWVAAGDARKLLRSRWFQPGFR